jgi:hypothetical protein
VHIQHARDAGGIKVATDTQVHDGTHKRIYNITMKTPRVKISKYTIQRSKSYIKQIASEYGQEYKWPKSPEDKRWSPNPAQAKPEG